MPVMTKSLLLLPPLLLSATLLLTACGVDGPIDPGRGPAAVVVANSVDLGPLETNSMIRGRDGGYSADINGRSVWLYGDTFLASPAEDGRTLLDNSWSWTEDRYAADGIVGFLEHTDNLGMPGNILPPTEVEAAFNQAHLINDCREPPCGARWALWPGTLLADPQRDRALIFYHKIYAETGAFNFYGVGSSLAVWDDFNAMPQRPVFDPDAEHPTLMFNAQEPPFGSAAVIRDDTLYVYGCETVDLVKPCKLARVPLAEVLDRRAWRYYAGEGRWSEDLSQARPVFHGNDIMSIAYLPARDCYLAVYSEPLDTKVMLRTAPHPEGPWSAPLFAFKGQAPNNKDAWIYDALGHAEFAEQDGLVQYISYSREMGMFDFEVRLVTLELR
jgi:hypothetical protein